MFQLKVDEVTKVAGGDYEVQITAHVEGAVGGWVSSLFGQLVNGDLQDTNAFNAAMANAIANGANFNLVRIEDVSFKEFN